MGILHNKIHSLYLLSTYSFQMSAWYQIFDIGRHTVHGNDEKTKILVITKDQDDAKKKAFQFINQSQWDFFEINGTKSNEVNCNLLKIKVRVSSKS